MSDSKRAGSGSAGQLSRAELQELAADPATRVSIDPSGKLILALADGSTIEVPGGEALLAQFRDRPWQVPEFLENDREALAQLVAAGENTAAVANRIATQIRASETGENANSGPSNPPGTDDSGNGPDTPNGDQWGTGGPQEGRAVSDFNNGAFAALNPLGGLSDQNLDGVSPLRRETAQFGRDDIKRGEVGAAGQTVGTGVGTSMGHLTGLPDEEPGLRNGEKLTHSDNTRFSSFSTGVGDSIGHLWLLGDFEYYRAADDFREVDPLLPDHDGSGQVYGPLMREDWPFTLVEDNVLTGTLFHPDSSAQATDISWDLSPKVGTLEVAPDGTFKFTPANGFSGDAKFTLTVTDPRTGEKVEQPITIPVAAVVDDPIVSGAGVTPEDTRVAMPITVELGDKDGSETIEKVVLTDIPAGADLQWTPIPGATVVLQPDGSYLVTGKTAAIQKTLKTLTILPPDDFSGQIVIGVDVTVAETNVPSGTKILKKSTTLHHDYVLDVIPVADVPDVTGDIDEVTPEDTRVLLDELAGNLNDLDGSEVLSFEITGVDPNAKLEDTAGNEYPFTIGAGGTKTYTLTPAQIGDVFFNPPPDAFGTFNGMTITAIATEQANNDQATNSAPIEVVVTPVADPIDIVAPDASVDEDGTVNVGAAIAITFGDPDGSEVLTDVTVTGFPAGSTVRYVDFTGTPQTINIAVDGSSISFNGGTEAQIRAALATLTVQPPLHSDVNIPLNVQATMVDGGVDTLQNDVDFIVEVAAIADAPTLTAPAHSGIEDQDINVPFQVGHPDVDGTEHIEEVVVSGVPDGFVLTGAAPGATITDNGGGSYTVTGTSDAAINALLNTLVLDIQPGGNRDDLDTNFSLGVAVTTIESQPTTSAVPGHPDNPGGEVTQLRNTQNFTLPVTVHPDVDLPTIGGSTTANEDAIVNPANQAVTAPINFGNNITISQDDSDDGSEVISSIVLTGFPEGAVVTWNAPDGTPNNVTVPAGGLTVTLNGGTEAEIRTALATVSIVPPLHDDADIDISVTVNKTDATGAEAEAADTDSITATHTIIVNAVADGPSFGAAATGQEDTDIPFVVQDAGLTGADPSLIDQDGSETYDFARFTLDPGATLGTAPVLPDGIQLLSAKLLGDGRMEYTFAPGAGTTTAQFEDFLNTGLTVRPPLDSDENFNVEVEIGTIESNPTEAGGFSLERFSRTETVEVEVTPVVDTWSIASTTSVNEDGITNPGDAPGAWTTLPFQFGADLEAGITKGETAVGDTSETISAITITGIPDLADLNFVDHPTDWDIDTSTPGQITITSPLADPIAAEAAIRVALLTLSLDPDAHSDADIPLGVAIEVTDTDPDDPADTTTQTFNGTHLIEVSAVADAPAIGGSGSGNEDETLDVSIAVTHPDADGSERIQDVVIDNVPAGLILAGKPAGFADGGTLTANPDGTYTIDGPDNTAIQTLLANLELQIDPGDNSREHLDTEFDLTVIATIEEHNPSVDGLPGAEAAETSRATTTLTSTVPVTVTAIADDVTHSGQSVVIEDTQGTIGTDIDYGRIDLDGSEFVTEVEISGFPVGAVINYSDENGVAQPPLTIVTGAETITFTGPKTALGETAIRAAVDSLQITAPPESDVNFELTISATTTDNDASANTTTWQHPVIVQGRADAPTVNAGTTVATPEDTDIPLTPSAGRSSDGLTDNSETLSVRLTLPQDSGNPIGTIVAISDATYTATATGPNVVTVSGHANGDVTITDQGNGVYLIEGPGTGNQANDAAALDAVLQSGIINLRPRAEFSGNFTGANGIRVDAISTEAADDKGNEVFANDTELAPDSGADPNTRTEEVTDYIDIQITPVLDTPTFTGSSLVQENGGSTNPSGPDLTFNLGGDLGIAMPDRDGSQTLDLKLDNIPDTAVVDFGGGPIAPGSGPQVIDGVTVEVTDVGGTLEITVSGTFDDALPADVIDVLERLDLTLADDDDTDFTVGLEYTSTETLTGITTPLQTGSHQVTVQAVADRPSISGSGTGNEDTFIAVPITVTLNDTDGQAQGDGSETLQSVQITGIPTETGGAGVASGTPQAQFQIFGIPFDWATDTDHSFFTVDGSFTMDRSTDGTLIFTPQTAGDAGDTRAIQAALQTLRIKRGDHVGDDFSLSVRAVSVESNPTEANNNGPGVNGDQIATATATTTTTVNVDVIPVTDPVDVTAPATITIDEDGVRDENGDGVAGVRLTDLMSGTISQVDADGSETLTFEITGLSGGTFSHGTDAGGGTWTFTQAEFNNAVWTPPLHATGTFTGTITVTTQDEANGGVPAAQLTDTENFSIVVKPDPDVPNASGSSVIYEDAEPGLGNEGNFGADISYSLVDTDGSEQITQVEIDASALPADWVVSFNDGSTWTTTNTGGTLPANVVEAGGVFTITGTQAEIRTAVDTFVVAAPPNSDANSSVSVSVTTTDTFDPVEGADDTFTGAGDDTDGDGSVHTATRTYTHQIRTLAIADAPDVTAGYTVAGDENDTFALVGTGGETIQVDRSADTDGVADGAGWGSEQLHVEISGVPDGVSITGTGVTNLGGGVFRVNALNEDQLNARLDALQVTPGDWSGETTLTVTAITTEQGEIGDPNGASGLAGIEVRQATDIDTITLRVAPEVDEPRVTGNAIGTEDNRIKIPLRVDLTDTDGSEVINHVVISGLPTIDPITGDPVTAQFVNSSGAPIGTETVPGSGVWEFTTAEIADLHIQPPLNWSSEHQGDIVLDVQANVTDSDLTASGLAPDNATVPVPAFQVTVEVQEVADTPNDFPVSVSGTEDQPYELGQAILTAAGAATVNDLIDNTLTDSDGSESLSFVVRGLPAGVIPTSAIPDSVTYIGGGNWSVTTAAIPTLTIPPEPDYSGTAPYSGAAITVQAVSQEVEGDQASSAIWPVTFEIAPVIDAATVDGLVGWNPSTTVTEAMDAAPGTDISMASIAVQPSNFVDNDGSEDVLSYTIDFAGFVDAGSADIIEKVRQLMGDPAATSEEAVDWVLNNRIGGDPADYTLVDSNGDLLADRLLIEADRDGNGDVIPAGSAESKIAGLSIGADIFDDSDVDFSLDVSAEVRDRANLSGGPFDVLRIENTTFDVNIEPMADTPTVSAANPDNDAIAGNVDTFNYLTAIPLTLSGDTTDNDDIDLGRTQSELIYFTLEVTGATEVPGGAATTVPELVLMDAGGNIVGLDNGDGSWVLSEAEVAAGVNLFSLEFGGPPRQLDFTLTTVAEDGPTRATNSTGGQFQVIIDPGAGGVTGTPPVPPEVNLANLLGQTEDTSGALGNPANPVVTPGAGGTPVQSISVMFTVPPGVTVTGATFNPNTGRWVASHTAFNDGTVQITPADDSDAPIPIEVEAVAVGTNFLKASTGVQTVNLPVEAVADAPTVGAAPDPGVEDAAIDLDLSVNLSDTDGSESIGSHVYVRLNNGATLLGGYPVVTETVDGVALNNYYKVPSADLATLQIQGAADWHGTVTVEVAATSIEAANGDEAIAQRTFTVDIEADADAPLVTAAPGGFSGDEDTSIALNAGGGLTAALADTEAANGAEVLSVKIENVPDGTLFSAGSNNGDGTWTIPVAALATLSVTPPTNFAGDMQLRLTGLTYEQSNGDEAQASVDFTVTVAPKADDAELLPQDTTVDATGRAPLTLDVRMTDDRGSLAGELPPEEIRITFQNVPTGVALEALSGGTVTDNGGGEFVFQGSEDQANDLAFAASDQASAGTTTITIASAETVDGGDTLDLGFTDSFRLTVPSVVAGADAVDDALTGGAGTQLIFGLSGADTLSGGAGADGLFGGTGADIMTGGSGADVFGWETGDVDGIVDTITDFVLGDGDAIDISDVLQGFDELTSVLSEYVRVSDAGADTRVEVDVDGGGDSFQDLVVIENVTGLDADSLRTNGNLIV